MWLVRGGCCLCSAVLVESVVENVVDVDTFVVWQLLRCPMVRRRWCCSIEGSKLWNTRCVTKPPGEKQNFLHWPIQHSRLSFSFSCVASAQVKCNHFTCNNSHLKLGRRQCSISVLKSSRVPVQNKRAKNTFFQRGIDMIKARPL